MPRVARQAEPLPRPAVGARFAGQRLEGMVVLCIDNEHAILEGMAALLGEWGCEVETALDKDGALAAIAALGRNPDIVLADYHLESGTGIEAIEAIRARHGNIPCVLVTADRSTAVKAAADAQGIAMLHKPVRPAGLRLCFRSGRRGAMPPNDNRDQTAGGVDERPRRPSAMTACVRLSTPSFSSTAETCAFTVASDTPSS